MRIIDVSHPPDERGRTAAFLLEGPEPVLVDCGCAAGIGALEAGLADHGLRVEDLGHLLLTHIHLDHAGAAGVLAARSPQLTVWVHALGARHLIDPARLLASAAQVFGDDLERLFGDTLPVPADQVRPIAEPTVLAAVRGIEALPTPGHARHHLAFADGDGTIFAGDVGGACYEGGRYLLPEAPPPDIDIAAWQASLATLAARQPARLAITHYGVVEEPVGLLRRLAAELPEYQRSVGDGPETYAEQARARVVAAVGPHLAQSYLDANWLEHSYHGFARSARAASSDGRGREAS